MGDPERSIIERRFPDSQFDQIMTQTEVADDIHIHCDQAIGITWAVTCNDANQRTVTRPDACAHDLQHSDFVTTWKALVARVVGASEIRPTASSAAAGATSAAAATAAGATAAAAAAASAATASAATANAYANRSQRAAAAIIVFMTADRN